MEITKTEVERIYRHRFREAERAVKAGLWRILVEDWLSRWISPADRVLDVGCGFGEFLNHVRAARRVGVDLNADATRYLDPAIEFHHGDVRDLSFLGDASIDLVFTSNLLEHLPGKRDVERLLGEVLRVLRPGGHVIALGPNLRFLPGEYWDFWDHQIGITDRSLVELLVNLGYQVTDCYPQFLPYTTRSRFPKAAWLVKLYLRLPLVWPVFGRQFLIRARKA